MEIIELKPRVGDDVLRSFDDGLIITDHFVGVPAGRVQPMDYGIILICVSGKAQFEYDGKTVHLNPNDLFLFFARSVMENFMSSPDFNCREMWFSRGEMWDMNMYGKNSLSDLVTLKQSPKVTLTEAEYAKFDVYFQLLCQDLRDYQQEENQSIIHSLFSTVILEVLAVMRQNHTGGLDDGDDNSVKLHGKMLADKFVKMAEQSDGRLRKVDDYAQALNVTPKYLSKLVHRTMGRKPSVIIAFFTLKAIENRLRFTDKTMQQIADELHFSTASSFGKFVRDHTGMTPLEFRKKYQKK